MTKLKDTIDGRLRAWIANRKEVFENRFDPEFMNKLIEPYVTSREQLVVDEYERTFEINNQIKRSDIANRYTKIDAIYDEYNPCVVRAFRKMRLDERDPRDWAFLLVVMADILFSDPDKPGRPAFWDGEQYSRLVMKFGEIKKAKPNLSDNAILLIISKKEPFSERKLSLSAMKKAWKQSRDELYNEWLRISIDDSILSSREETLKFEVSRIYEADGSVKKLRTLVKEEILADWMTRGVDGLENE